MIFQNISNFNNIKDYLPILNGCIIADLIVLILLFNGFFPSNYLKKWYKNYHLSACIADVLILFIGIIITRFFYRLIFNKFNIIYFTILALIIQVIHDILFYLFFMNLPNRYNFMLDFFKLYAKEVGPNAILGDSFMMLVTCLFSSYFATLTINTNIIYLVLLCYLIPYMIYFKG
jgi:uncharacterized protein YacL